MMSRMSPGGAPIYLQVVSPEDDELRAALARMDVALAKSMSAELPYRGIFRDGEKAEPGQFWTFQGSLFHCDRETTKRPTEDPDAWTLAVKRGRNGKDAGS